MQNKVSVDFSNVLDVLSASFKLLQTYSISIYDREIYIAKNDIFKKLAGDSEVVREYWKSPLNYGGLNYDVAYFFSNNWKVCILLRKNEEL